MPLVAFPRTMMWAPELSHPTSSEAGPTTSIRVPGKPIAPTRCPDVPRMRRKTGSFPARQRRPPRPCWPWAMISICRCPSATAFWMRSSRTRESTRTPFSDPGMMMVGFWGMTSPSILYSTCRIPRRSAACRSVIPIASDMPMGSEVERPNGATIFLSSVSKLRTTSTRRSATFSGSSRR